MQQHLEDDLKGDLSSDVQVIARQHAVLLLDRSGRVVGWNQGAEHLEGYRAEEIIGRSFEVFYPPEEVERGDPARHLAEAVRCGHVEHEGWRVRRDGSRFWADVVLTAVVDEDGVLRGFGKVTRDASERRNAARAVRRGEEHVALLAASARDHAVLMLAPDGRVTSWSAGAERVKGYAASDIIGRSFDVFYPPEDVERGSPGRHLAQAAAAGHAHHQGWRVRADGSRFWADVVITAILDDDGRVRSFGKVTYDASRAGDPVPDLRDGLEDIGLWVAGVRDYAMLTLDAAGQVVGWNAGAERIKGYRSAEIIGRSFEVFYPPDEAERGVPARHLADAAAAGHVEYEGWRVRKDGSRFWADVVLTAIFTPDGALRGYGKVTRDATARRNAERALHDSQEHFELLTTSVSDYAILMLDLAGRVVSWNAGAERIKGYAAEEIIGRSFEAFYPPGEVARGEPARHLADAAAAGHVEYEGWRLRKDGSRFWADVVLTALFDDTGALRGYGKVTHDATDRLSAKQALRESEEHFALMVASVRDYAILMLDPVGRVVSWNAGAERIKGYSADQIVGRSFAVFYPPEEVERGEPARHLAEAASAGHVEYEGWRVRQDGSRFWADVVLTAMVDDEGRLRGFGKVTRDVTERRRLDSELTELSLRDPLTGLGNRNLLMERLDHARSRLSRRDGLLTLFFLDLDRFKLVNDTLGHDAGDELLIKVAGLLRRTLRPEDTVVRFGGDEFVVLCEDLVGRHDVEAVARRLTDALNVAVCLRDQEVFLSASIGVVSDGGATPAVDLLRDADAAMYRSKGLGGGRYTFPGSGDRTGRGDRLQLGSELHRALERGELRARYQPLDDLRTRETLAYEALVRWQHPERGLLAPAAFLEVAEAIGAVVDVDAWMLRTACRDAAECGRRVGRPVGVWVNLSGRSLAHGHLPDAVAVALADSGLHPGLLTLEITERALMRDAASTVRTLTTLRELGVDLAVDDFGTGYSSLAYLQRFPVHALKVDRSFVAGLDLPDSAESAAIVRAIAGLAAALDLRTVAEGIETSSQLASVTALGCDLGQGFLLGRPAGALAPS